MLRSTDTTSRGGSQTPRDDTRGFALPTVLVLMMVLSTLSVFLLSSSSNAQKAGRALRASARSFYAADAGVNVILGTWESLRYDTLAPNPGDSVDLGWTTLDNGAQYRVVFVRVDGGTAPSPIHSVRVTGRGPTAFGGSTTLYREIGGVRGLFDGANAAIEGGVGGAKLDIDAEKSGGVMVSGRDTIPSWWMGENICDPLEDVPGAIWQDTTRVDYSPSDLDGAPDLVEDAGATSANLLDFIGLDYDDLVAMADITVTDDEWEDGIGPVVSSGTCVTSIQTNWGDPTDPNSPCFDYFPIVHFTQDEMEISEVGGYGQGILLFDGELEIEDMEDSDFNFFGIIIQKGPGGEGMEFEEDGINLYGSIIAGGNVELEDGARIRYSQCAVDRALAAHGLGTPGGRHMSDRVWRQKL